MRPTLSLPKRTVKSNAAAFANHVGVELPKPAIETKSRLFEPEFQPVPKRRKEKRGHLVASTGVPMPNVRQGELNRPDKSTPKTNLTFNWSPA